MPTVTGPAYVEPIRYAHFTEWRAYCDTCDLRTASGYPGLPRIDRRDAERWVRTHNAVMHPEGNDPR